MCLRADHLGRVKTLKGDVNVAINMIICDTIIPM